MSDIVANNSGTGVSLATVSDAAAIAVILHLAFAEFEPLYTP